jgi:1,4-dihydroxy-2-naphthoyl-CoA hydrolase
MPDSLRDALQRATAGRLPGLVGVELVDASHGSIDSRLDLRPELLAPNGYLHAATVVALADTSCGMGCIASLPDGVAGFTTIELKTNFLRTAGKDDGLRCSARLAHGGARTQIWDATVARESDGKEVALFRCTQYLLPADDPRTAEQAAKRAAGADG